MRPLLLCWLLIMPGLGCTSTQLTRSTVSQASTLTELQYQQVLNNLAMFAGDSSAIPSHVNLRDGSDQISDYGSAGVVGAFGRSMGNLSTGSPSVIGSRTVVEQWGVSPVTDDTALKLLQIAYRRAFGHPDTLDDDRFANDLAHEIKKQVSVTDDLKDLYKFIYKDIETTQGVADLTGRLRKLGVQINEFDVINRIILSTNDDDIIQKRELVSSPDFDSGKTIKISRRELFGIKDADIKKTLDPGEQSFLNTLNYKTATPVIQEVRRLVKKTESDLETIHPFWFGIGCHKKDVPQDACYVGYHRDSCGEHYVWVCPAQRGELAKFTLTILSLSSLLKESQLITVPGGPRFAPSTAFTR